VVPPRWQVAKVTSHSEKDCNEFAVFLGATHMASDKNAKPRI